MIETECVSTTFTKDFLKEITAAYKIVFSGSTPSGDTNYDDSCFEDNCLEDNCLEDNCLEDNALYEKLEWRLTQMPDATVFVARIDGKLAAFKAGYATSQTRYYSWLGGVLPNFRSRGIARDLMNEQHQWLLNRQYNSVETYTKQHNTAMIQLNIRCGLQISGMFMKSDQPYCIMQKKV